MTQAERLREALQALVEKLDEIAADRGFQSIFTLYAVHGGDYRGPNWLDALSRARAVLADEARLPCP